MTPTPEVQKTPQAPVPGKESPPIEKVACPEWYFGIAAFLLLLRPTAECTGLIPFLIPPHWETISLFGLIMTMVLANPSREILFSCSLWILLNEYLRQFTPVPEGYRWMLLLFIIEFLARKYVPQAWCLFWLLLPAFHAQIVGEPLCPLFYSGLTLICLILSYRATLPKWQFPEKFQFFTELAAGIALGISVSVFPSLSPATAIEKFSTLVFDESHHSSETALGEQDSLNGHQQMVRFLRQQGTKVVFIETRIASFPSGSVFISILPTTPFLPDEVEGIVNHVRNGGKAVFIADHTDMDGSSSRLAPILENFGVRVGFDTISWPGSSHPATGFSRAIGGTLGYPGTGATIVKPWLWLPYCFRTEGPHPLTWISASSEASSGIPSQPLNRQMSDPPKRSSSQGSHWVGAWGTFGKGSWALFSDSSWFQNTQLALNTEFLWKILSLLHSPPEPRDPLLWIPLFLFLGFCFSRFYRRLGKPLLPLGIILGLISGDILYAIKAPQPIPGNRPVASLAVFPSSPAQVTSLQEATFPGNLDVFLDCLHEAGWKIALPNPENEQVKKADLWVLPPSEAFPPGAFLAQIDQQVNDGATLILIGNIQIPASRDLLLRYGFILEPSVSKRFSFEISPLGLPQRVIKQPTALNPFLHPLIGTWSLPLWSDFPVPMRGGEGLFQRPDGLQVIGLLKMGKGKVVAVSDPAFFSNEALEIKGKLNDATKKEFIRNFSQNLLRKKIP